MSYGLGNLLSSIGTAAATPALSTYAMDAASTAMEDSDWLDSLVSLFGGGDKAKKFLSDAAGGTLSTALSAGLGAGLGALSGGSAGAAGGALTGLISGGGAAMQHEDFKHAMGMDGSQVPTTVNELNQALGNARQAEQGVNWSPDEQRILGTQDMVPSTPGSFQGTPELRNPVPAPGETRIRDKDRPGYFSLAAGLGMPAIAFGSGLTSSMQLSEMFDKQRKAEARKAAEDRAQLDALVRSIYHPAYAQGGMTVGSTVPTGTSATVHFPQWFIDEYARSGGITDAMAAGGYVNTGPFDPNNTYPQKHTREAQSFPAASPIRNEVLDYEDGGLLQGPGDGMSDSMSATIDGEEEARVADGEYVVPSSAVKQYGDKKLHRMMTAVRHVAQAQRGEQPQQDAAKRAFIRTISGVHA